MKSMYFRTRFIADPLHYLKFVTLILCVCGSLSLAGQNNKLTVTGKINDEKGEPLTGVSTPIYCFRGQMNFIV